MLGSCFTEHIGQRLIQNKFQAVVNPFGVVYNPASIFEQLRCAMSELESPCSAQDGSILFRNDGIWNSWLHDSSFSNFDEDEFMNLEYYTPEEVEHLIDINEIVDAKTIANFQKARKYLF